MVIFKLIPNCQNYYAGYDGEIYSNFKGKYKKLEKGIQSTGKYYVVSIVMNNLRKSYRVHRLVCLAFYGIPEDKMTASHLNGNWKDNRPENLQWESYSKNHQRKKEHGTDDIGVKNRRSLITFDELLEIRKLLKTNLTQQAIGDIFGVSRLFITKIKNGYRYKGQGDIND